MNAKFKELAEQCWDLRLDGRRYFDQEMFAKLIVQECINVAFERGDNVDYLKEHFEVD
jgi:hypothetical protein